MKSYAVCYAMEVIQKRKLEFYVKGANGSEPDLHDSASESEASNQNMAYNTTTIVVSHRVLSENKTQRMVREVFEERFRYRISSGKV